MTVATLPFGLFSTVTGIPPFFVPLTWNGMTTIPHPRRPRRRRHPRAFNSAMIFSRNSTKGAQRMTGLASDEQATFITFT
jgi:hypothetical protein